MSIGGMNRSGVFVRPKSTPTVGRREWNTAGSARVWWASPKCSVGRIRNGTVGSYRWKLTWVFLRCLELSHKSDGSSDDGWLSFRHAPDSGTTGVLYVGNTEDAPCASSAVSRIDADSKYGG